MIVLLIAYILYDIILDDIIISSNIYMTSLTKKSPDDDRDWVLESIINYNIPLPPELNYSTYLYSVQDQGKLGTCAAMTACCIKEFQENININLHNKLSPMFVYNLRQNQKSEGMYGRDVMKILTKYGICLEKDMSYGTIIQPHLYPYNILQFAANLKIKAYAKINTINGLKKALNLYGPCYISFPTFSSNVQMWKPLYKGQKPTGGHAMSVIGYNLNSFIIRNSWGKKWGDKGNCYYYFDDFGYHWEIWSLVDDTSEVINTDDIRPKKKGLFSCCK